MSKFDYQMCIRDRNRAAEKDRLCSQQSLPEPQTDLGGYGKDRPYERSAEIIRA